MEQINDPIVLHIASFATSGFLKFQNEADEHKLFTQEFKTTRLGS